MTPIEETLYLIRTRGWARLSGVVSPPLLDALRADIEPVHARRRAAQIEGGVEGKMEGIAHHVLGDDTSFDTFVNEMPCMEIMQAHFSGKIILLNFGAVTNEPGASTYTHKIHRDVRTFTRDCPLSLNMLVMLDDFTEENGATLVLDGSHHLEQMPPAALFAAHARPLTGLAGDVVLFDSLLAHSAATNRSHKVRRALTLCFGRPFIKPQMDWTRFLSPTQLGKLTPIGRQLLGLDAQPATSLQSYYQPPERWTFKADQI
ncbi:phytanoyl-CoA dioxygenase family protein [Asticcacaulis sp.]|uniref:phytanoyl-CoA dioxygenase family protein n=1 Tax=Asticcacaulis sp. TaxID=1872648 RepID=UPI0039194ED7